MASMAQEKIDELSGNIADARKRDLAFGLCLGKSPETTVLVCHKTKDPETLGRQAKKDGETAKIAFGLMSVKSKDIMLSCAGEVPPGLARKVKEMMKAAGLKMKIMILDAEGNLLEAAGDAEDGEGPENAPQAAEPDPMAETWAAEEPRISQRVTAFAEATGPDSRTVVEKWEAAKTSGGNGDATAAVAQAKEVEAAIDAADAARKAAEADREKWLDVSARITPHVEEALAQGGQPADKIRAVWAFAQDKVKGPKPDFAAAIKSVAMLVKLIGDAKPAGAQTAKAPAMAAAEAAGDSPPATAAEGEGSAPPPAGAAAGAPPAGGAAAGGAAAPGPSGAAATPAAPAAGDAPGTAAAGDGSAPQKPDLTGTQAEKVARADAGATDLDKLAAAYLALIPGSGEPMPPKWATEITRIKGLITPMKAPGAAVDAKALDQILKDITTLANDIRTKSSEKEKWKKARDLIGIRLTTLDHHAQAASVEMAPKIAAIKAKVATADAAALAQKFTEATKTLGPLAAECDSVEASADACAHYKVVHGKCQALVAASAALHPTGVADIDKLHTEIADLLTKATADGAAGKFADAVKKLDQIPAIDTKKEVLRNAQSRYAGDVATITAVITRCDALGADDKKVIQTDLTAFKKTFEDAKYPKTKDYSRSYNLMTLIKMKELPYFDGIEKALTEYRTAYAAFKPKYDLFKAHPGREGIEPFFQAMEADLLASENEIKVSKPGTAAALLKRSAGDWPNEEKRANDCKAYKDKLAIVKPLLDAQRAKPAAATPLAQADALVATAANQALARDYAQALANITEAEKRAADAKAAGDAGDALGALKDGAALGGIATDFAKALKVFTDMRANVAGQDAAGTFAPKLTEADTIAAKAQAEAAKPAPNWGTARGHLDAAIAVVEGVLPAVKAFGPWQTHLAEARTLINTTLPAPAVNRDDCIKGQIADAKKLLTEAEALAAAPKLDIAGAEAKLSDAMKIARQAQSEAALYPAIAADVAVMDVIKVTIAGSGPIAPYLATRVAALDALKLEVKRLVTARDIKGAAAKAREGALLSAPTNNDIVKGTGVLQNKLNWYDNELPNVTGPGREICLPFVLAAVPKYATFLVHLNSAQFDLADESIKPPAIELLKAKKMLAGHTAYEPKRAAAEAAINSVKGVRCPPVEKELADIEKRYAAAAAQAAAGAHPRAEPEMTALPPLCVKLVATAVAFKDYDTKRAAARAKLDEALSHKEAKAIQPMLTRLTAKYDGAVKLADSGDFAGAARLMPEIVADAVKAIESADNAATLGMVTGALDAAADTGMLPQAVIAGTQMVLDKLNARPEKDAAKPQLDTATAEMAKARAGGSGAKSALKAAIAACEAADETMSQFRMLEQSVVRAKEEIAALKAHPQTTYIAGKLGPVETAVNGSLAAAKAAGDYIAAATALEAEFSKLRELKALADGYGKYVALRAEAVVEPRLDVLEKHDHRYAIKPSIDTMRAKLADAAAKVSEFLVPEAIKLLEDARAIGQSAFVMAEMRANRPPKVSDIKEMLARPGGQTEVDAMIDTLEPDAVGAVVAVVFEARFGCKLQMTGGGVPSGENIKRYYQLMSDLPAGHTVGNDSLLTFTESPGAGSKYDTIEKDLIMDEGRDAFSKEYGFGRDFEVGGQDEECKPTDTKPVSRFSWNTLHEVGHAVDDKHGFMNGKAGKADFGGWTEYGGAVGPVAQIFATQFKYDRGYIEKFMLHNNAPPLPPAPAGVSAEEWEKRRIEVTTHIALAFDSNRPWNSNAQATRLAIGGIVYQESYPGSWYSYNLSARKQGMTGYQFRAPGEWFSELYAAYHIGKMKPGHPAMSWVAAL